jgi:hypothetical protein
MRNAYDRNRERFYVTVRNSLKAIVPDRFKPFLKRADPIHLAWHREDPIQWPLPDSSVLSGFEQYEYSLFSQNGEDGILRHLFDEIGFRSRKFLEFGFEGTENNCLRLVLKEDFKGVFIDGSDLCVRQFNKAAEAFGLVDVKAVNAFLDLSNLEGTIRAAGVPEDIDLLSLDVDGNDYWFWEALRCVSARVVVIEYNASLGPELSLTIPYDAAFDRVEKHSSTFYHGASLVALQRLGSKKGYDLVGCDANGVNAFFVRRDCMSDDMPEVTPGLAYRPHKSRLERGFSVEAQFAAIQGMPFVEVES